MSFMLGALKMANDAGAEISRTVRPPTFEGQLNRNAPIQALQTLNSNAGLGY